MSRTEGVVLGRAGHELRVLQGEAEIAATLRGKLKYEDGSRIVAGDRVTVVVRDDGSATIEDILPRRSVLARRAGDARRAKPVAANIDLVCVVAATQKPDPNPRFVDRLLVIAEANVLTPIVVINKIDLGDDPAGALEARYRPAGYEVLRTSSKTGAGIAELRARLIGQTSVLTGLSGVGKSSLLNAVEPGLGLRTREVSEYWGTGKHTTVSARLVPIEQGGFVVDTPGLREVALWGIAPVDLPRCFPEFRPHLEHCRFTDCRHLREPQCAVRDAAEKGRFNVDRLVTYARMREEAEQELRSWS